MVTTRKLVNSLKLIEAERARQIAVEGFTPAHDDAHGNGELARAAAWYAFASLSCPWTDTSGLKHPSNAARRLLEDEFYGWPWEQADFKPAGPNSGVEGAMRNLVKAGALIAAEIDRLQRQRAKAK